MFTPPTTFRFPRGGCNCFFILGRWNVDPPLLLRRQPYSSNKLFFYLVFISSRNRNKSSRLLWLDADDTCEKKFNPFIIWLDYFTIVWNLIVDVLISLFHQDHVLLFFFPWLSVKVGVKSSEFRAAGQSRLLYVDCRSNDLQAVLHSPCDGCITSHYTQWGNSLRRGRNLKFSFFAFKYWHLCLRSVSTNRSKTLRWVLRLDSQLCCLHLMAI